MAKTAGPHLVCPCHVKDYESEKHGWDHNQDPLWYCTPRHGPLDCRKQEQRRSHERHHDDPESPVHLLLVGSQILPKRHLSPCEEGIGWVGHRQMLVP
jgi:hypothetical protein